MCDHVSSERRVPPEGCVADVTLEGFVVRVNGLVPSQRRGSVESSEADFADESPISLVSFNVRQD